jgi:hypothetical protein
MNTHSKQLEQALRPTNKPNKRGEVSCHIRMPQNNLAYLKRLAMVKSLEENKPVSWVSLAMEAINKAYPIAETITKSTKLS